MALVLDVGHKKQGHTTETIREIVGRHYEGDSLIRRVLSGGQTKHIPSSGG